TAMLSNCFDSIGRLAERGFGREHLRREARLGGSLITIRKRFIVQSLGVFAHRFVLKRVFLLAEARAVVRLRHQKAGRKIAVEETGSLELGKARQIFYAGEAEVIQKDIGRAIGDGAARSAAAASKPHPADLQQQVKGAFGRRDAANLLDFGTSYG